MIVAVPRRNGAKFWPPLIKFLSLWTISTLAFSVFLYVLQCRILVSGDRLSPRPTFKSLYSRILLFLCVLQSVEPCVWCPAGPSPDEPTNTANLI